MEENDIWNLEVEPPEKVELTENEKRLALAYSEYDMLSRDILPILDYSLDDNNSFNYEKEN